MELILRLFAKSHEQRSCKRKVRYGHEATALRATQQMHGKTFKEYEAYECSYCEGWHIATKGQP